MTINWQRLAIAKVAEAALLKQEILRLRAEAANHKYNLTLAAERIAIMQTLIEKQTWEQLCK
jgi:hypothetical protein